MSSQPIMYACLLVVSATLVIDEPWEPVHPEASTDDPSAVALEVTLPKPAVMPGEPFEATLTFRNTGAKPTTVNLGANGIKAVTCELRDLMENPLLSRKPPPIWGLARLDRFELLSGQSKHRTVVASRWLRTPTVPGQFTLIVTVAARDLPQMTARADLEVVRLDEAKLAQVFARWREAVESADRSLVDRKRALELLSHASSPLAVPDLLALARNPTLEGFLVNEAVGGLSRLDSGDGVKGLIEVANAQLGRKDAERVKNLASAYVFELHERSKKREVLEASREFVNTYPRVARPQEID